MDFWVWKLEFDDCCDDGGCWGSLLLPPSGGVSEHALSLEVFKSACFSMETAWSESVRQRDDRLLFDSMECDDGDMLGLGGESVCWKE